MTGRWECERQFQADRSAITLSWMGPVKLGAGLSTVNNQCQKINQPVVLGTSLLTPIQVRMLSYHGNAGLVAPKDIIITDRHCPVPDLVGARVSNADRCCPVSNRLASGVLVINALESHSSDRCYWRCWRICNLNFCTRNEREAPDIILGVDKLVPTDRVCAVRTHTKSLIKSGIRRIWTEDPVLLWDHNITNLWMESVIPRLWIRGPQ